MLIKCPECDLQISDKAIACPHCGYPINPRQNIKQVRRGKGRRKLPNGFGQITELKNSRLRNKFRVMITIGRDSNGRPIQKLLKPNAYFKTYNDAYEALVEYNKNPYDLDRDITVGQLYEQWTECYFPTLKNQSSARTIKSSWSRCKSVERMRVKDLRARHIKGCMDEGESANMKERIKSMFNIMLDYALEYEIVDMNYARTFSVSDDILTESRTTKNEHIAFKDDEIEKLWDNISIPYVDVVLIQMYTGLRPQEIGLIRLEDVHINESYFTGGMKTDAGIDRLVPIHSKIKEFVNKKYNEAIELGSEYLINCTDAKKGGLKLTYDKYKYRFDHIVKALELNIEHRPHDPRKTFITLAKKYKMDEYAIKYIAGHSIDDITEKIYTERELSWYIEEIEKIQ